jgi:hypothetical protein
VRIGHHAGELGGAGVLVRRLLGARLAQERFGQLDGAMGEDREPPSWFSVYASPRMPS